MATNARLVASFGGPLLHTCDQRRDRKHGRAGLRRATSVLRHALVLIGPALLDLDACLVRRTGISAQRRFDNWLSLVWVALLTHRAATALCRVEWHNGVDGLYGRLQGEPDINQRLVEFVGSVVLGDDTPSTQRHLSPLQ